MSPVGPTTCRISQGWASAPTAHGPGRRGKAALRSGVAFAWKHAPATHARRSRTRSRTPLLLSQKARVRTCPTLTRSSLALPPRSKRAWPGLGAIAFVPMPARTALLQRHGCSREGAATPSVLGAGVGGFRYRIREEQSSAAVAAAVANHSSRVEPADACFRDCIGAAWQLLTAAPMLRPRRAMCVRHRLPPVIRAKVGKHWIARPRLMLCLWKQRCCTSTPTSSCTDSRTAPAMQRSRARRRDECSSSNSSVS